MLYISIVYIFIYFLIYSHFRLRITFIHIYMFTFIDTFNVLSERSHISDSRTNTWNLFTGVYAVHRMRSTLTQIFQRTIHIECVNLYISVGVEMRLRKWNGTSYTYYTYVQCTFVHAQQFSHSIRHEVDTISIFITLFWM